MYPKILPWYGSVTFDSTQTKEEVFNSLKQLAIAKSIRLTQTLQHVQQSTIHKRFSDDSKKIEALINDIKNLYSILDLHLILMDQDETFFYFIEKFQVYLIEAKINYKILEGEEYKSVNSFNIK